MRALGIILFVFFISLFTSYSLDPVRVALFYSGAGSVAVEVQLYDYGTSSNIYPGTGNQSIGSLAANSNGVISFVIGEDDANWAAIASASVNNNYMLIVTVGGTPSVYLRLDKLLLDHGMYNISIGTNVFDTRSNVTSNRLGDLENDDFVFGSTHLANNGDRDHRSRFFFDKSKSAFRAGYTTSDEWDESNVGTQSTAFGINNEAKGFRSAIGGGDACTASDSSTTVSGGSNNESNGPYSTVGGGLNNVASGRVSTVSGGEENTANNNNCTVGGGLDNVASGNASTVSGGDENTANGSNSVVSGGYINNASANYSVVSGGNSNTASGQYSVVSGGQENIASGVRSVVSGGRDNIASGGRSVISGGQDNIASGDYSVVAGGYASLANGEYNLVFGNSVVPSVTENYRIYFFDEISPGMMAINREDADYPIHVGTDATNGNGAHLTAGGTWTSTSSITKKDRFDDLNESEVLNSICKLPIKRWYYKSTQERHIGPFAEDFHKIFGTGDLKSENVSQYLSTMDVAGVSLRGVQILISEIDELKNTNSELKEENDNLRREIDEIKSILNDLRK